MRLRRPNTKDGKFTLGLAGKKHELTFEETFAYGYSFIKKRDYAVAEAFFKALLKTRPDEHAARIMLALCQAGQSHFDICRELLESALEDEDDESADRLHAAFVSINLGLPGVIVSELTRIVKDSSNLPVVCLLLGHYMKRFGQTGKANTCFKMAISRDDRNGAVALSARAELNNSTRKAKSHRP